MSRAILVALLAVLAGCHEDPTEIILVVDTDLTVPDDVDTVHITVTGTSGATPLDRFVPLAGPMAIALPLSVALEHQSGAPLQPVTIAVVALRGGMSGSEVLRRDARTGFVAGETRLLRIILSRACLGRDCGTGNTCQENVCLAQLVAGTALPPFSALPPRYDGGVAGDGTCRPELCNGMDDDCDGHIDNGFDLQNEVGNCGTCGNDCRTKPGVATAHCAMGACVVDTCVTDRGDCGGGGADGCETDTSTSAAHCGACATSCSTTHDTPTCTSSTCSLSCTTGFADCDTMLATGCEADLTDVANCGRCFHHCTATCAGGYCDDDVIVSVVTGGSHGCALRRSGHVVCWGSNGSGRLGDGTMVTRSSPADVVGLSDAIAIAAGDQHTCAIRVGGSVVCWGHNDQGQLGTGSTIDSQTPISVTGVTDATAIAAGLAHTCVVRTGGGVKCWGRNVSGQIGNGTTSPAPSPADVGGGLIDASAIVAGQSHTCALRSTGGVACWGLDDHGQLGTGSLGAMATSPVAAVGIAGAVEIASASGANHTCVRDAAGVVSCWGLGGDGAIGDGSAADRSTATVVTLSMAAAAIGVGARHSCAALADGSVSCWGADDHGQLGDGLTIGHPTPMPVVGAAMIAGVVGGNAHSCARDGSGAVSCWGWNSSGQLGDGTMTDHARPAGVRGLPF